MVSIYCELKSRRSIEARSHERFHVELTLKNPNEESESVEWEVTVPPELALVKPHDALTGKNELQPGEKLIVARWRVDISKIPLALRTAILERSVVRAKVLISPLGSEDFCQARLSS